MLDIADQFALAPPFQQFLQFRLALAERQATKILTPGKQQVEGENIAFDTAQQRWTAQYQPQAWTFANAIGPL